MLKPRIQRLVSPTRTLMFQPLHCKRKIFATVSLNLWNPFNLMSILHVQDEFSCTALVALSYYKQCECQLTGSLQAGLLFKPGPKVGGHLAPCCAHRMNQGELSQCCFQHDDSIINIVLVLLLNTYTNH